ncbi:SulP family inorganic anion transporter [Sulfurirhabdus autotrophica]|uniref:SulP family sulfate permease n=2 Tax=Sulfurirhabdus autotrophica TaxID=1706046 RepID=A0A4R3YBZ6_9PROT|nr:SulP family inorganic anion transporter [Sulfurirhabdus autotrophica]TCV89587.1 SulP family sulfate permease [Sulfurirhabdus autotrophica]
MTSTFKKVFPFLRWLPLSRETLRADIIAGVTVALVLIPQSMAYAQLAGMPAYYGLYAAFLPVMVGALWGSSSQLATGPVAVVSLLTASALAPLAAVGTEQFIALAILLAFLVGVVQLSLGVFRLGALVNLISHPVIIGFMNAAAIIIGLSQLNKLIGVSMSRSDHFLNDIWGVVQQLGDTHLPTLFMGVGALTLMLLLKRYAPKLPGVLITVAITTLVSWSMGFESKMSTEVSHFSAPEIRSEVQTYLSVEAEITELEKSLVEQRSVIKKSGNGQVARTVDMATVDYRRDLIELTLTDRRKENRKRFQALRRHMFASSVDNLGNVKLSLQGPGAASSEQWRISKIDAKGVHLVVGGEVVGNVRPGLPTLAMPHFDWDSISALLSAALVISLVAFMEAISIAKAMAAKTRERIDPNRELIGQGLANITASFSQSFPVSGSFSRSAVNIGAGAVTGLSSVFSGLLVLITLLFLTPLLYHLPQAVLAAIIMLAVIGLINFKAMHHAWKTQHHDGTAAIVTFIATLFFAPHLDMGILVGAGVAISLFMLRQMEPRAVILGRLQDGRLGDIKTHHVTPVSSNFVALRYDGSLDFVNAVHFEDVILKARADYPDAKAILVVGEGINSIDASGEEKIREITQYLKAANVTLAFSSLKKPVRETFDRAGLTQLEGEENLFSSSEVALQMLNARFLGDK